MGAYQEEPEDAFDFDRDWFEATGDQGPGDAQYTPDGQESTRIGYIRANKERAAVRFFLGFAHADPGSPWRLRREPPHWDPTRPWLFAYHVGVAPTILEANPDNENNAPNKPSPFAVETNRYATYKWLLCTVRYRSYNAVRFLPDAFADTPANEARRWTRITTTSAIETLSADGVSNLTFAETGAGGPVITGAARQVFPAPVGVLLPKMTIFVEWLQVPREYVSTNPHFLHAKKILDRVGSLNDAEFLGLPKGTLLLQPPEIVEQPWHVPSDDSAMTDYTPLTYANIKLRFDYFDPPTGAAAPVVRGHNLFPYRGTNLFYLCTRDGSTDLDKAFLRYTNFGKIFEHVGAP